MSIASRIDIMKSHIEDVYNTLEIAGTDLTDLNKNIINIESEIENNLKNYLADGTDNLWNNCEKVTVNDVTSTTLNNTIEAKMKINLKGNAMQNETPTSSSPQDIHVVTGDNTLYSASKNLAWTGWANDFVARVNLSERANLQIKDNRNCLYYNVNAGYGDYDNKYMFKIKGGFKENTQYTFSFDIYATANKRVFAIKYTDNTTQTLILSSYGSWQSVSITSTANKTIKYIYPYYTSGFAYIDIDTFQCEIGTSATLVEPYTEIIQTIHLGNLELAKIDNYIDKLFKAVNGNSIYNSLDNTTKASLTSDSWYKLGNIEKIASYNGETITTTYISTTGGLDTGATIYYVLVTPTYTKITDTTLIENLNNLETIKSNNEVTNIFQTNDDLPFILDVTAIKNF